MAAPKYITRDASTGVNKEVLASETSAPEVVVATGAGGKIDSSFIDFPVADTFATTAGETLAAGDFVYIKADGKAWHASAAVSGNEAIGYVLAASAASAPATVYFEGINNQATGLTVGGRVYLSDSTPGGYTQTPVTGAGKLHQLLGYAKSATEIDFDFEDALLLAS